VPIRCSIFNLKPRPFTGPANFRLDQKFLSVKNGLAYRRDGRNKFIRAGWWLFQNKIINHK
jgi:hypothetical protein